MVDSGVSSLGEGNAGGRAAASLRRRGRTEFRPVHESEVQTGLQGKSTVGIWNYEFSAWNIVCVGMALAGMGNIFWVFLGMEGLGLSSSRIKHCPLLSVPYFLVCSIKPLGESLWFFCFRMFYLLVGRNVKSAFLGLA